MIIIPKFGYFYRKILKTYRIKSRLWNKNEIERVLENYNIKAWKFCNVLGGGNSDNILIQTNQGKKVIKRYYWSLQSTIYEHSIIKFLMEKDFPIIHLVPNKEGSTYTILDNNHYSVSNFINGHCIIFYHLPQKTFQRYVGLAGKTLAQLHQLMIGFEAKGKKLNGYMPNGKRLWRGVGWHLKILDDFINEKQNDRRSKFLLSIRDELRSKIIELGEYYEHPHKDFVKLVIHGDYSPQNILFKDKNIKGILDFGDANLNLRSIDIARGIETFSKSGKFNFEKNRFLTFIKSYQAQQKLSKREILAIPDLMIWRNLRNIIWSLNSVLESQKNQMLPEEHFNKIFLKWKKIIFIKKKKGELISTLRYDEKN